MSIYAKAMAQAAGIVTRRNPKKGTPKTLKFEGNDGRIQTVKATFLGSGLFTDAYLGEDNKVYLVTVTDSEYPGVDDTKGAIAEMNRNDGPQPHIPMIERVGWTEVTKKPPPGRRWYRGHNRFDATVYRSPLYNAPLRKGNATKQAWSDYRALGKALEVATGKLGWRPSPDDGYKLNMLTIENFQGSESVKEALESLASYISNYGTEYAFEFPARNLATDAKGQLILLDPLYNRLSVQRLRR